MNRTNKCLTLLLLIALAFSSFISIELGVAQSIAKPSVPQFTVETISAPYDVPSKTTTTTDPYTGKQIVTTQPGYHVENKTMQLKIKNQPFTPYQVNVNGDNWTIDLFYNIRIKGHFAPQWGYYRLYNGSSDGVLAQKAGAQYTIVKVDDYLPKEGQVDFQVEALEGYEHGYTSVPGAPGQAWIITGQSSGLSNIQTFEVRAASTSPSPSVPEFPVIILGLPLVASVMIIALKIGRRKR